MGCDPDSDPFRPPKENTTVCCIHCGDVYDSYRIEWRIFEDGEGFWCCPIEGCDGKGFRFDIHPTDPDWQSGEDDGDFEGGWFDDDGNPMPFPFGDEPG